MKPKAVIIEGTSNKKVYFGDAGEIVAKKKVVPNTNIAPKVVNPEEESEPHTNKPFSKFSKQKQQNDIQNLEKKWFEMFEEYNTKEIADIKDSELTTLRQLCKSSFNDEAQSQVKNNPTDAKWLGTALHKGTAKDRANAGALLVQSNPLPNNTSLDSLIGLTKFSNKSSVDVLEVVTELFVNSLLPHYRKLIPLQNRGNDWKLLKAKNLEKSLKDQIYAYWYYENELKEHYHAYLMNLQASLQNGKEPNKIKAIISASNLLRNCPERENFLLTIVVNKFGDPDKKIASKATYNLRQILLVHPNMVPNMVIETEKLIFRNNITELAQHYGIGFLSLVAPIASVEASQKLINICFCFFKIKIEKGDIKSKTMQSILNCLRVAIQNINDFNVDKKKIEITTPEVVNTIYRLIYLSNISIAFQALSLLLQLVLVQDDKHDRYYNALYKKMVDPDILNANNKITSLYFHILHRSIQQDTSVPRAKAFIKRLIQMAASFGPGKACGALIVINKILKSRPELISFHLKNFNPASAVPVVGDKVEKENKFGDDDDDDEDETYQDVLLNENGEEIKPQVKDVDGEDKPKPSSWNHKKHEQKAAPAESKFKAVTEYDPFKRSAAFCGAEFSLYYELIVMTKHFHPTVQLFVENILHGQKIKYFGDPLRDFSLPHFLERFSFKNPKKMETKQEKTAFNHNYQSKGSRGQSVHLLTAQNCTEDEKFLFDYFEKKRVMKDYKKSKSANAKDEDASDVESIDDDEFDEYLNSLGAAKDYSKSERDFDYLGEMKDGSNENNKTKKKKKQQEDSDDDKDDWDDLEGDSDSDEDGEDDDDDNDAMDKFDVDNDGSETDESLDEESMQSDSESEDDDENGESDKKKSKSAVKNMKSKLKERNSDNMFVAVDDFSEMIEKNSSNTHGTLGEIFNKDKSSDKQMDWEEKRRDGGGFKRKQHSSFKNKKSNFSAKKRKFKK